jgi:hypothetical protein
VFLIVLVETTVRYVMNKFVLVGVGSVVVIVEVPVLTVEGGKVS